MMGSTQEAFVGYDNREVMEENNDSNNHEQKKNSKFYLR
jgi:hypothetical protein